MPPKFYFTTKSELAEEERKRFLKEVEELPPTAPLRQDLSAFLPATRDNTTTTSPYEQSQQTISQERYIKEQDRKRTALSGRTYGENKFIREGGNAIASGIMEMSPIGDARDVATAIEDPSLTNIGVAGLAMLPVVGKGLKKVAKGVKAVDSAKNLQKLDNAIIKNNPEMEKLFSGYRSREDGIKLFPKYDEAGNIALPQDSSGKLADLGKVSESEIQSIRKFAKASGNKTDEGIARMIAADKAGYTTPAFHSTKADIERFEREKLGASTGAESAKRAYFFAENPITSGGYADVADASKLRPELNKLKQKIKAERYDAIRDLGDKIFSYEQAWKQSEKGRLQDKIFEKIENEYLDLDDAKTPMWKLYDLYLKEVEIIKKYGEDSPRHQLIKNSSEEYKRFKSVFKDDLEKVVETEIQFDPKNIEMIKEFDKLTAKLIVPTGENMVPVRLRLGNNFVYDAKGGGYGDFVFSEVIDKAKEQGFDSVTFKNVRDGARLNDPLTNVHAIFDEENIRSPFAEFDLDKVPKDTKGRTEKMKAAIENRFSGKMGDDKIQIIDRRNSVTVTSFNKVNREIDSIKDRIARVHKAQKSVENKLDDVKKVIWGGGDDLTDAQQSKILKKRDSYEKDLQAGNMTLKDLYEDLSDAERDLSNVKKGLSLRGALGNKPMSGETKKQLADIMKPLDSIPKSKKMKEEIKNILNVAAENTSTDGYLTVRSEMRMKEALGDKYQDWEDKLYLMRDMGTYRRNERNTPIDLMDKARRSKMRGASSDLLAGVGGLGLGIKAIRDEKNKKETK